MPGLSCTAGLAWARGDNRTTGEALPYIAPLNTRVDLEWKHKFHTGSWWISASHEWARAQDRVPAGVNQSESWQTVDLCTGFRVRALDLDHELQLGVTNLFDEDYSNFLATSRGMTLKEAGQSLWFSYKMDF